MRQQIFNDFQELEIFKDSSIFFGVLERSTKKSKFGLCFDNVKRSSQSKEMKIQYSFFFLAVMTFNFSAQAYIGSISSATGRSGAAAVDASEAPFTNAAALPYLRGYFFSAGWGATQQSQLGSTQDLAVSLIDNMKDTVVPTSLAYSQQTYNNSVLPVDQHQELRLGFGNIETKRFSFGLAGLYQTDRLATETFHQMNVQMSGLYALTRNWGFAVIANNMLPAGNKVPEAYRQQQSLTLGTSFDYKDLIRMKFDVSSDSGYAWGHTLLGGGVENYLDKWMIFRIGAQRDNQVAANIYTAGLGFAGPKFSLNYAYQNSAEDKSLTRHSVDLAVPLW